ncbi:MAG: cupin domain-containing protein [Alphaproteobacteria bacterium]
MDINEDFAARVVMHGDGMAWQASPIAGVNRRMLDRIGDEVARATTIVRFDPGSAFSPHVHTGGEEFFVLEGVFQDEQGDFPAGSYIRNPPQSRHTPGSAPGCTILVKLWQFDSQDRTHIVIDTNKIGRIAEDGRPGVTVSPLFEDHRETVRLEHWAPGTKVTLAADGGAELFVLEGGFIERGDELRRHSWLRVPMGGTVAATAGPDGAKVWVKTGHLRFVAPPG